MGSILRNTFNLGKKGFNVVNIVSRFNHLLASPALRTPTITSTSNFLAPLTLDIVPNCGFKTKGFLRKRCKDCVFVTREERLYVICKTHPRHKQMAMMKSPRNSWILTHATQGKIRPW